MTLKVGEIGKLFRYSTGFDMSGSTALDLKFTKPDQTQVTISNPRVTAPATPIVNDPDIGNAPASTYMQFTTEAADFDQSGKWSVCGIYTDATPKEFHGNAAEFTVEEAC
jgi:hypothetical protein